MKEFTNDTNLYTLFYKLIGQLKHGLINCVFVDLRMSLPVENTKRDSHSNHELKCEKHGL